MSDHSIVNLLVIDRELSEIEGMVQALRGAGHMVQELHSDQVSTIRQAIDSKPWDLILARQHDGLPGVSEICSWVTDTGKDIPVLAIMDDQTTSTPLEVLRSGAANYCLLSEGQSASDMDHFALLANTELRHLHARRDAIAFRERLAEAEMRFRSLLDSSRDAIAYIHEGAHVYANRAYLSMFGYDSEEDLEGVTLMNMVVRDDRDKLKAFLRRGAAGNAPTELAKLSGLHRNATVFPVHIEGMPTRLADEPCLQIVIRSSPQRQEQYQELQKKLVELRQRDVLTGLYNRRYFSERLERARQHALQGKPAGAVLYILLTSYRSISEKLGLEAVELLTMDVANLLRDQVQDGDMIGRFSDAVFTVHTQCSSRQEVMEIGERICRAIAEHASHAAKTLIATTSCIGACQVHERHESVAEILGDADRACETARQMGGNQVQIYTPPSENVGDAQREEECTRLIEDALAAERMSLVYQPIASLHGDTQPRFKAYLRILDENDNPLPLRSLVPIAERRGIMYAIDKWSITRGLEILTERYQLDGTSPTLFVRISRNSVIAPDFAEWLENRLKDTGLSGSVLTLEVAEDCAEQYFKQLKVLRDELRRLHCGFAITHFGDRPNSERMLHHLAPDYVKLDTILIDKLVKDKEPANRRAVTTLTEQARTINALVVADGVATAPQMASIWQFGVALAQGDVVQEPSAGLDFDFEQFAA